MQDFFSFCFHYRIKISSRNYNIRKRVPYSTIILFKFKLKGFDHAIATIITLPTKAPIVTLKSFTLFIRFYLFSFTKYKFLLLFYLVSNFPISSNFLNFKRIFCCFISTRNQFTSIAARYYWHPNRSISVYWLATWLDMELHHSWLSLGFLGHFRLESGNFQVFSLDFQRFIVFIAVLCISYTFSEKNMEKCWNRKNC